MSSAVLAAVRHLQKVSPELTELIARVFGIEKKIMSCIGKHTTWFPSRPIDPSVRQGKVRSSLTVVIYIFITIISSNFIRQHHMVITRSLPTQIWWPIFLILWHIYKFPIRSGKGFNCSLHGFLQFVTLHGRNRSCNADRTIVTW